MGDRLSKISVCFVSPNIYPLLKGDETTKIAGGAEAQLRMIGLTLAESSAYAISYIVSDFGQSNYERIGAVSVHKAPIRYMGGPSYHLFFDWLNFFKVLRKVDADIYVIKLPRNLLLPLGVFCRFWRKKLVMIGQIDADVDLGALRKAENSFSYWCYRIGMRWVNFVVSQNDVQLKGFREVFGKKSAVIKNIQTVMGQVLTRKDGYILWVGRNLAKKRPELFVKLAEMLPEYRFKMIMAPSRVRDEAFITDLVANTPNLEYLGFVPFVQIAEHFQRASLFVSTSELEGFPNTFLHAWQFGTPVASLQLDPDGVIERYQLGCCAANIQDLAVQVRELMEYDEARKEAGARAIRYVDEHHSKAAVVKQYEALFGELVN